MDVNDFVGAYTYGGGEKNIYDFKPDRSILNTFKKLTFKNTFKRV